MDSLALADKIRSGQRRAVARGLTLVESTHPTHQDQALELFRALGMGTRAFRLGVTGPPGAGKSTLIERLLLHWVEKGDRIAVLAIDPSSRRTGGSILGDKTRMGAVADHHNVYIRPSPTGEHLGGLGRRTPLMCALLERAGFNRIVVETVGVGQSEIAAKYIVDTLLLVALPGAGDEVQGIKRGLMEEVDVIAVNKSDLGNAKATVATLRSALRVFRREVSVFPLSAQDGSGLEQLWSCLQQKMENSKTRGPEGDLQFLNQYLLESLMNRFATGNTDWEQLCREVADGKLDLLQALPRLDGML